MSDDIADSVKGMTPGVENVKHLVAIASGKGGVGKSTVCIQLAYALSKMGKKVGILDADIYGPSGPKMTKLAGQRASGVNGQMIPLERDGVKMVSMSLVMENDAAVVWRAPMANKAIQQFLQNTYWGELDVLLLDLPPGTGDIHITIAQQARLSGAVIVTTPQQVATEVARKGLKMFNQVMVPILGIVENMSSMICTHCEKENHFFSGNGGENLSSESDVPLLAKIPMHHSIMQSCDEGAPLCLDPTHSPMARVYMDLADSFMKSLESVSGRFKSVTPVGMELLEEGTELQVAWEDGVVKIPAHYLRLSCPCASCIDEITGKKILDESKVPLGIKILGIRGAGRYGVSMQFSDQHGTGIYRFDRLKEMSHSFKAKEGEKVRL